MQLQPKTATLTDSPKLGNFAEQLWGISASVISIDRSGRTLTTIYITHGHTDHYFGLQRLLEKYPSATAVTHPSIAAQIEQNLETDRAFSREFFAGEALDNTAVPEVLDNGELFVDGELVRVIERDQADIGPTTALHIPAIDAVIAGDAVYNQIHLMLAASSPAEWSKWIDTVDAIAALNPNIVVAGHKKPELPDTNVAEMIESTRAYIEAFIDGVSRFDGPRDLVGHMQQLFPEHENQSTLIMSARTAFKAKSARA